MNKIIYEELISLHPRIIDWNQSWEFVFKYTKPLFDRYNSEWFYKWISNKASHSDLCESWDLLKTNWKLIKFYLDSDYRFICPICGCIKAKSHIRAHLYNCGVDADEVFYESKKFIYDKLNPNEDRLCPVCKKKEKLFRNGGKCGSWGYYRTCGSPECVSYLRSEASSHRVELYGAGFNPHSWTDLYLSRLGLTRDSPEYINKLEEYSKRCSRGTRKRNLIYGDPLMPRSWSNSQIVNNGYTDKFDTRYLEYCSNLELKQLKFYKSIIYLGNVKLILDSQNELWTLLYILSKYPDEEIIDSQHYYPNNTDKFDGVGAYSDIRTKNKINNLITNWEVHDDSDIINIERKKFCTELNNNIFKLVSLNESDDYYFELDNEFPVKSIFDKLVYVNRELNKPLIIKYKDKQLLMENINEIH